MAHRLIDTADGVAAACRTLQASDWIALDTEFIRETSFFPQFEILQLATRDEVFLVDVSTLIKRAGQASLEPVRQLIRNRDVLKVIHACLGDQECLYWLFKEVAEPVFDTAIGGALLGIGDSPGLATLMKNFLNIELKKGHSRTNWAKRPLPEELLEYAAADVEELVHLAEVIKEQLDKAGRWDWALKASQNAGRSELYDVAPEAIAERLGKAHGFDRRDLPLLIELVRWREDRVRRTNRPRRWVADDSVLLSLCRAKPKTQEQLMAFRGLQGEAKHHSAAILDAVVRGLEAKKAQGALPPRERRVIPTSEEQKLVDVLKAVVSLVADQAGLSPRFLCNVDDLTQIVTSQSFDLAEWVKSGWLNETAAPILGETLVKFLKGELSIRVEGRKVGLVE